MALTGRDFVRLLGVSYTQPFIYSRTGVVHGGRLCPQGRAAVLDTQIATRIVTVPQILKYSLPRCVDCWTVQAWDALLQAPTGVRT